MRYIGSKTNVLDFLNTTIHSCVGSTEGMIFADLFTGTTAVSQLFKKLGHRIISNDYMAFSYVFQLAYLKNCRQPSFINLRCGGYLNVLSKLNSLSPIEGFFYKNYCRESSPQSTYERNYFSGYNAGKIDAIMTQLREWKERKAISETEDAVLRASLIDAVTKISNISGTYAAFLKHEDPRMNKQLSLKPLSFIPSSENHFCHNEDILSLIDKTSGDILYLDPPYNQRQYPPYYHVLETIALDDNPAIYGKTGRRPYQDKLSPFCMKSKVKESLRSLIDRAQFKHIFLSYSTEGLISVKDVEEMLSKFGEVNTFYHDYRRYRSNKNGETPCGVKEVLFYVSKN